MPALTSPTIFNKKKAMVVCVKSEGVSNREAQDERTNSNIILVE
jgi:hypothetical protein